jgi:hypothetical protein
MATLVALHDWYVRVVRVKRPWTRRNHYAWPRVSAL